MQPHCMVLIVHVPPISSSTSCPSALVVKATEQLAWSVRAGICALMSIHAGTEDGVAADTGAVTLAATAATPAMNAILFIVCSLSLGAHRLRGAQSIPGYKFTWGYHIIFQPFSATRSFDK